MGDGLHGGLVDRGGRPTIWSVGMKHITTTLAALGSGSQLHSGYLHSIVHQFLGVRDLHLTCPPTATVSAVVRLYVFFPFIFFGAGGPDVFVHLQPTPHPHVNLRDG